MPDEDRISSDEASPLLGSRPGHRRFASVASLKSIHVPQVHKKSTIINLICLTILLASSSGGFLQIPQARLIEDVLCHEYYDSAKSLDVPIDEQLCKAESIQGDLAYIIAITSALSAGVGFAATFPWSLVADKVGRKPVLSLCLAGLTLGALWTTLVLWFRNIFPVRLVWLESVGQLIGGGTPVAMGLLFSMTTDATNEEERGMMFLRIHIASVCGNLVAPTLSSFLMSRYGPWPPTWIGLGCIASSVVVVMFIPETLHVKPQVTESEDEDVPDQKSRLSQVLDRLRDSLSIIKAPSLVLLLIISLFGMPVTLSTGSFMPVFMSKRYDTKLYQGGYVQTALGAAQIVHSLVILPWISRAIMQSTKLRPDDEHHRDLSIARWSAGITMAAAFILGLAPTLAAFLFGLFILSLGTGLFSLVRSLMSLYVDPVHRSRLFGLVGMVEIVGQIYAQPMLAELFKIGMRLGGEWIGLPYFGLSILVAIVTGLLLFVKVTPAVKSQAATGDA
ncbi:hypothetical protein N0V93_001965 [Gnomoniopsis smithogilvyi]|uniref:Major facilitator superfamily (MFS) profile domain-containing protein n=1 Tax=Gnomoniopsis smithogilvyi TaxID=1191159 RepID=A0A9W9D343_9PEZI|nr:hypothetical protein N0V93_001965 [Gnomoniopsis smithogilvyi]